MLMRLHGEEIPKANAQSSDVLRLVQLTIRYRTFACGKRVKNADRFSENRCR